MNNQFTAIKADQSHAPLLGQVHAAAWQAAYRGIVPDRILSAFTPSARTAVFRSAMADSPIEYYLFQVSGVSAGLALLSRSHEQALPDTVGELYAIYFHPDFWGTAVTCLGMDFCMNRLQALGFHRVNLWVLAQNTRARRFYEKYGFSPDGRSKEIELGTTLQELCYTKAINP